MISRTGPRKKARSRGFTLIELLIVCVIILALISVSMPLFKKTFTGLELRETVSNISKFMTYAQQRAIIDGRIYKILFNFDEKNYQLLVLANPGQETAYSKLSDRFGRVFKIPADIEIEGTVSEMLFYPDGHTDTLELKLKNTDNKVLKITATGLLGNVTIAEEGR